MRAQIVHYLKSMWAIEIRSQSTRNWIHTLISWLHKNSILHSVLTLPYSCKAMPRLFIVLQKKQVSLQDKCMKSSGTVHIYHIFFNFDFLRMILSKIRLERLVSTFSITTMCSIIFAAQQLRGPFSVYSFNFFSHSSDYFPSTKCPSSTYHLASFSGLIFRFTIFQIAYYVFFCISTCFIFSSWVPT